MKTSNADWKTLWFNTPSESDTPDFVKFRKTERSIIFHHQFDLLVTF